MKARRPVIALTLMVVLTSVPSVAIANDGPPLAASSPPLRASADSMAHPNGDRTGYLLPLPPPPDIVTPFRPPAEKWGTGHRGVDLAAPAGSQIRSAGSGVVAFAGRLADRNLVSVKHSAELRTTYEPVLPLVAVGQHVVAGQPIGILQPGHPPCAPGACLHWGARIGAETYLDPMMLLTGWPVRLKPWDGLGPEG